MKSQIKIIDKTLMEFVKKKKKMRSQQIKASS